VTDQGVGADYKTRPLSAYSVEKLCFRRQFWSGEVAAKSIVLIRATKKWARKRP
jgi:hypothetical protein